ncbi:MAG: FAD-dependent oxidoreductase, partial [Candidatus Nanopelagicales bacterium]
ERTDDGFRARVRGDDRHRGDIQVLDAHAVVVATGAFDRQLPFPGWALPGVMSGGAAQALVKGSGVLPGQRIAIAGTGPFLLAVAATVLDAGGNVAAVIEANDPISIARRVRSTLPVISKSGELAGYLATLARHRVPYLRRHRVTRAHGADHLESITVSKVDADWCALPGTEREIEIDALAIGYGFTAQTDVLGAARFVRGADGGIAVAVDDRQETSVRGLFAAGETTGVGGVDLAAYEGLLAGAAAAEHCGMAPALTVRAETQVRRRVGDLRRFADTLHATFPVREGWRDDVDDATLVCRCEEVSAQQVRDAVRMGATDARSVKLITRAGMGWCQGRVCGPIVDGLCGFDDLASLVGAATRPVAAPVPLGALAGQQVEG